MCTSIHNIEEATVRHAHLKELKVYIIEGWPHKKDVALDIQKYWPIRHELAMKDGVAIK